MERLRIESKLLFVAVVCASVWFYDQINWIHYVFLFWVIDVFGYWPGYVYSKLSKKDVIHPFFYRIYNSMHDLTTVFIIMLAYVTFSDAPYSVLGIPLHISIDRGLLGNYHKKPNYSFHQGGLQA